MHFLLRSRLLRLYLLITARLVLTAAALLNRRRGAVLVLLLARNGCSGWFAVNQNDAGLGWLNAGWLRVRNGFCCFAQVAVAQRSAPRCVLALTPCSLSAIAFLSPLCSAT